jgi:hypothetical protein
MCYHVNDLGEVGGDWVDAATFTSPGMLLHSDGKLVTFPNGANELLGTSARPLVRRLAAKDDATYKSAAADARPVPLGALKRHASGSSLGTTPIQPTIPSALMTAAATKASS